MISCNFFWSSCLNKAFMPKTPCDCVYFARFFKFSVWYTENLRRGDGGGREQRKGGGLTATASGWLLLGGSFYYWPTSYSRDPVTFQSLQLSNWGTVLCFLDSTRQNSRRTAHLVALGQLAQHYVIRIIFITLNIVTSVGPNSPHAMGSAPLTMSYGWGLI